MILQIAVSRPLAASAGSNFDNVVWNRILLGFWKNEYRESEGTADFGGKVNGHIFTLADHLLHDTQANMSYAPHMKNDHYHCHC